MTDSEQVPWGKDEKKPEKGSEIDPETPCLQAVEAFIFIKIKSNGVPFV